MLILEEKMSTQAKTILDKMNFQFKRLSESSTLSQFLSYLKDLNNGLIHLGRCIESEKSKKDEQFFQEKKQIKRKIFQCINQLKTSQQKGNNIFKNISLITDRIKYIYNHLKTPLKGKNKHQQKNMQPKKQKPSVLQINAYNIIFAPDQEDFYQKCLKCIRKLIINSRKEYNEIFGRIMNYKDQNFQAIQLRQPEDLDKDKVNKIGQIECAFLNSMKGGSIFLACKKQDCKLIPIGVLLTEKQIQNLQKKLKALYQYNSNLRSTIIQPEISQNDEITIDFIPAQTYQLKDSGQYIKNNEKCRYVIRINIKPKEQTSKIQYHLLNLKVELSNKSVSTQKIIYYYINGVVTNINDIKQHNNAYRDFLQQIQKQVKQQIKSKNKPFMGDQLFGHKTHKKPEMQDQLYNRSQIDSQRKQYSYLIQISDRYIQSFQNVISNLKVKIQSLDQYFQKQKNKLFQYSNDFLIIHHSFSVKQFKQLFKSAKDCKFINHGLIRCGIQVEQKFVQVQMFNDIQKYLTRIGFQKMQEMTSKINQQNMKNTILKFKSEDSALLSFLFLKKNQMNMKLKFC